MLDQGELPLSAESLDIPATLVVDPRLRQWFTSNIGLPTSVQLEAWQHCQAGRDTLISAPTGTGKTLAAFLVAIDQLAAQQRQQQLAKGVQVLYISPLRALSYDIETNLHAPLNALNAEVESPITVGVRTGDTKASDRARMMKNPPHIMVTTPESLFILLTSKSGRAMLSQVKTVILDELQQLMSGKRGSHLSLSLQRLRRLRSTANTSLQTIGLSATIDPLTEAARFMAPDSGAVARVCADQSLRPLALSLHMPELPLTSITSEEIWGDIYADLQRQVECHTTTLIFANTRRLAERVAHNLQQLLGPGTVMSHHGSLSRDKRFAAQNALKQGKLQVIVATASLELGIDIGHVDLVCQLGSAKAISTLVQRIGRSGRGLSKQPKGRIYPLTISDLIEAAASLSAISQLEPLCQPPAAQDVLAQQLVAEICVQPSSADELWQLFRASPCYQDLRREDVESLLSLHTRGISELSNKNATLLRYNEVEQQYQPRSFTAWRTLTNAGTIPDLFEFDVVLQPQNEKVGTVHEDFALEAMAGDIFLLGNTSYRLLRIHHSTVEVIDAQGLPPMLPFWLGEGLGRSDLLSEAVSRLASEFQDVVTTSENVGQWLATKCVGLPQQAVDTITDYWARCHQQLTCMPTFDQVIVERFFDDSGDAHLVIHSCFGIRVNRAWGLALRKKFCRRFNFELQALALDNGLLISLGATHSFPVAEPISYLHAETVRTTLIQALLDAPMFATRWRWVAGVSLAVNRHDGSKRVPAPLQRAWSENLLAQVFPDQLACAENLTGERDVPDHPLVRQTLTDCLSELMDIAGLEQVLRGINAEEIRVATVESAQPSALSEDLINARPYAYLDDAPLEERRTRSIASQRWYDVELQAMVVDGSTGFPEALVTQMSQEIAMYLEVPDVYLEDSTQITDQVKEAAADLHESVDLHGWISRPALMACYGNISEEEQVQVSRLIDYSIDQQYLLQYGDILLSKTRQDQAQKIADNDADALQSIILDWMYFQLLFTVDTLHQHVTANEYWRNISLASVQSALAVLEGKGLAAQGCYVADSDAIWWCYKSHLSRLFKRWRTAKQNSFEPISLESYSHFLQSWHGVVDTSKAVSGASKPGGTRVSDVIIQSDITAVLTMLAGYPLPIMDVLAVLRARVPLATARDLDFLIQSGQLRWATPTQRQRSRLHSKSLVMFDIYRYDAILPSEALHSETDLLADLGGKALRVLELLVDKGALFHHQLCHRLSMMPEEVDAALETLVVRGLAVADTWSALERLVTPKNRRGRAQRHDGRWTASLRAARPLLLGPMYL